MTKEKLLKEINEHITLVSNLDPPPLNYIDQLQRLKVQVEIANQDELGILTQTWQRMVEEKS